MKKYFSPKLLPLFPLCTGLLGLLLRVILYRVAIDEKGLIISGHILSVLPFVLTAVVLAVLFLCIRNAAPPSAYAALFPPSYTAAFGGICAAVGILLMDIYELFMRQDAITIACLVLGVFAAAGLICSARCRIRGKQPSFLFHTMLTLYFMVHPLSQYRFWSADPQLLNYCFHLLASVLLMLAAYYRAALDASAGSAKRYAFYSQAALFFCCISIHGSSWLFYCAMAIWTATNLCACTQEDA